jgi:serine protease inhibitor
MRKRQWRDPSRGISKPSPAHEMSFRRILLLLFFGLIALRPASGSNSQPAALTTNQLGLDLYHQLAAEEGNLCLSPYSIETALVMTMAGAAGETRAEMARVLHLAGDGAEIRESFAALQKSLEEMARATANSNSSSQKVEPITLEIANRLFAQRGYNFRNGFLAFVKNHYGAPLDRLDFKGDPPRATGEINDWVAEQTRKRIQNLIPAGALDETTRMVLVNALYLKAPWAERFEKRLTQPEPFHLRGGAPVNVPMMRQTTHAFGYAQKDGFVAISLPYVGRDLQFVILLPNEESGLAALEAKLNKELLADCAQLRGAYLDLTMPKFRLEPPTVALQSQLKALGMKRAFDDPPGSADFDAMAPRRPNEYLYLSKVFHKTFIDVDEKGTEAAAATAATMMLATGMRKPEQPIEIRVDRPFVYLIQEVSSGVCLFIGRVTDPRRS